MPDKQSSNTQRRPSARRQGVKINSYYSSSKNEQPQAPRKKRNYKRLLKLASLDGLSALLLLGFLIYCLYVSPHSNLSVDNNTFHLSSDYQKDVDKHLAQFKNRNKITFDDRGLREDIERDFPEVQNVSVELPVFGANPKISLTIGQPAFSLNSEGANYLISSNGTAVGLLARYKIKNNLIPITDKSGFQVKSSQQVLSISDMQFIQTLKAQLIRKKVPVKDFVLPSSPEELDLETADESFYTKFFMGGDANLQAGQYLAARNNWGDSKPSAYLDVRVAGKIFYK